MRFRYGYKVGQTEVENSDGTIDRELTCKECDAYWYLHQGCVRAELAPVYSHFHPEHVEVVHKRAVIGVAS